MEPARLMCASLRAMPRGATVAQIMGAALAAVEPGAAVRRFLRRMGEQLMIGKQIYELAPGGRVWLISVGKAGEAMARAAVDILGERLTAGLVVVKDPPAQSLPGCTVFVAGHPIPDEQGVAAARSVVDLLANNRADDLVLVLLSGGGSALLPLPAPGVTLADLQALTADLLACGATIDEINCLRKHLDLVKGGGLARFAAPAPVAALILSDVVGSPLDVIASGPTVPDPTSFADGRRILEHYGLFERAPAAIRERLSAGALGQVAETPKPGDPLFANVQNLLVGSNQQAAEAALEAARQAGFNALLLTTYAQGEARVVGRLLAAIAREIAASSRPLARPACLVLGGETTVTLRGKGRGGRNQELALAAVPELAGLEAVVLAALATDGGDGPTDAAGAVVTGESLARALAFGLDPAAALAENDAYPFFQRLDDLLLPGPSGTNVNDLAFLFAF